MRHSITVAITGLILGASACGVIRDPDLVVAARIGKEKITIGDISAKISSMPFEQRAKLQGRAERIAVLNQIIDQRILLAEADAVGVVVTDDEMLLTLRMLLQAQGDERAQTASPEQLRAILESDEIDMPSAEALKDFGVEEEDFQIMRAERVEERRQLRERVREQARIQKLFQQEVVGKVQVSDEDARALYDAHPDKFTIPESIRFRYMSVHDLDAAKAVVASVKSGTPFEQLVKEAAADSNGTMAQEMPMPLPLDRIPADVRVPMADADPGDIVGPLRRGDDKYDLVQVIEHVQPALVPFDAVKAQVKTELFRAKAERAKADYVRELRDKYEVRVFDKRIRETPRFDAPGGPRSF